MLGRQIIGDRFFKVLNKAADLLGIIHCTGIVERKLLAFKYFMQGIDRGIVKDRRTIVFRIVPLIHRHAVFVFGGRKTIIPGKIHCHIRLLLCRIVEYSDIIAQRAGHFKQVRLIPRGR